MSGLKVVLGELGSGEVGELVDSHLVSLSRI